MIRVSFMVVCFLCSSTLAYAQVNTERFHLGKAEEEGWQVELAGRLALSRGNVNVTDLSGGLSLRHQTLWPKQEDTDAPRALKQRWSLIGNIRQARARDQVFSNQAFTHARWTRMWAPRVGAEVFTQLQFDEFIALRMRLLAGGYMRLVLLHTKAATLALGTGYMPEYEVFDQEVTGQQYRSPRLNHRWSNYVTLGGDLNPYFQYHFTSYVQPRFDRFSDLHMLQSLIASAKITEHLALTLTAEVQTDLEPPPTIEPVDVRVAPGLSVQW